MTMMTLRTAISIALLLSASIHLHAQGDSCLTAVPISGSGSYSANGPSSGGGFIDACGMVTPLAEHADWYVYTAPFSGNVVIRSCGGGTDTRLSVMSGTCGALTCVGAVDDNCEMGLGGVPFASELTISVTSGTAYYIQWDDSWTPAAFIWELSECIGSVQGVTYRDQNSNGLHDAGELVEPVMLEVNPGGLHYLSAGDPYAFCSDSGSYLLTVTNPPNYHNTVPLSRNYSVLTPGTLVTDLDFAFQPIPGIYDGMVTIWGWSPWIGNNTNLHITYCNEGTEIIDGSVGLTLDSNQSFVSSTPAANAVVGQVVTWNFTGMMPGACVTIDLVVNTDSTVAPGQAVANCVDLVILQSDIHSTDNHDCHSGNATTSFDPNEKLVDRDAITLGEVAMGAPLEYTIHFQNTGNAPAVNIVVKDSIDADLDITTFEMIDATHPYSLQVNDQVAIWTFSGIMLPDSTNDEPNSHGGIHFRIAPKATSPVGTQLTNRADIYFDYNAAVLTNTVITHVIEGSTAIDQQAATSGLSLYPSPTTGLVMLTWPHTVVGNARIEVLDAAGRCVYMRDHVQLSPQRPISLDLSSIQAGNYAVRLTAPGIQANARVVVE